MKDDDKIDALIAQNKAASNTRDGRGCEEWETRDTAVLNMSPDARAARLKKLADDVEARREFRDKRRQRA